VNNLQKCYLDFHCITLSWIAQALFEKKQLLFLGITILYGTKSHYNCQKSVLTYATNYWCLYLCAGSI